MKEILAKNGEVIEVGKPIAIVSTGDEDSSTPTSPDVETILAPVSEKIEETIHTSNTNGAVKPLPEPVSGRFYSPLVLNIARKERIPMAELETVSGTGKEGRVTKKDILSYVQNRSN